MVFNLDNFIYSLLNKGFLCCVIHLLILSITTNNTYSIGCVMNIVKNELNRNIEKNSLDFS